MPKQKHYELVWTDSALHITGPQDRAITACLTYTAKRLEPDPSRPYTRKVVKSRERIFSQEENADKTRTLTTFQGVLDLVVATIADCGYSFRIYDNRTKFPPPQFDRMSGFRASQEWLTTTALSKDRSGLVVAPTRYGKTAMLCNTLNAYPGLKSAVIAPGIDLLPQLEASIRERCVGRDVRGIYTGSKHKTPSDDITVCSVDSIDKLDFHGTRLVLVDEPHAIATGPRSSALVQFNAARFIGFGATVSGRWEGNDIMITGLFGPKLAERTYTEAVAEGAIAPIEVKFVRVPFKHFQVGTRATAYAKLLGHPNTLQVLHQLDQRIPQDWQTLFFISNEKHGRVVADQLTDGVLAMDKLMKNSKARREMFERLKSGDIMRCVASNIYSTGVTIDGIRCAVNCAEGGANILSIQKPGRLAELKPGKRCGYMVDFLFYPENPPEAIEQVPDRQKLWTLVVNDCWGRINSYREKGYNVQIVDSVDDIIFS